MTATDVVGRVAGLPSEPFEVAALWSVEQLVEHGRAMVRLAPGDATQYHLVVVAPGPVLDCGGEAWERQYFVALWMDSSGSVYPWTPGFTHPSYAAERWAGGQEWTGAVVARFLNAVAELLVAPSVGAVPPAVPAEGGSL